MRTLRQAAELARTDPLAAYEMVEAHIAGTLNPMVERKELNNVITEARLVRNIVKGIEDSCQAVTNFADSRATLEPMDWRRLEGFIRDIQSKSAFIQEYAERMSGHVKAVRQA